MDITLIIGSIGMLFILVAFILIVSKELSPRSKRYLFLNLIGGVLLVYYAYKINSVPFLILNTIWSFVAVAKLTHVLKK